MNCLIRKERVRQKLLLDKMIVSIIIIKSYHYNQNYFMNYVNCNRHVSCADEQTNGQKRSLPKRPYCSCHGDGMYTVNP